MKEKTACVMSMLFAGTLAFCLIFGLSLLVTCAHPWLNAIICICAVTLIMWNMTTWQGGEYNPDMMP